MVNIIVTRKVTLKNYIQSIFHISNQLINQRMDRGNIPAHTDINKADLKLPTSMIDQCSLKQQGQIKLYLLQYRIQHLASLLYNVQDKEMG
jgi:hypothetical protein